MPTRQAVNQQKVALKNDLRQSCRSRELVSGDPAPSLRHLAQQYGLSKNIVAQVLQELIDEGLFHAVPRVGTFVGPNPQRSSDCYLLITGDETVAPSNEGSQLQWGFETCIAEAGGAVLAMSSQAALERFEQNLFPPLCGVFDFAWQRKVQLRQAYANYRGHPEIKSGLHVVRFVDSEEVGLTHDVVSTDDYNGGRTATQYLLQHDHRAIAFLGLHDELLNLPIDFTDDIREHWSKLRELGWRHEMTAAGIRVDELVFIPTEGCYNGVHEQERHVARNVANQLVQRSDVTAVVAANDATALGLIDALCAAELPPSAWPAIVGFDDMREGKEYFITSLRVPWAEIGRTAATLLLERRSGKLQGQPQHRKVAMSLVQRLSSRSEWRKFMGHDVIFSAA